MANPETVSAQLSDLDLQVLELVSRLRVVTQKQLERLHPDIPDRTLRYRARRLQRLGLIGRTRPYRDRGSAPHHLWPTSRADALVRAEPPPRRGERQAPSPLFLAHTSAVSELYVVLHTRAAQAGLSLVDFRREGEAREAFTDADGRQRAIAPDARIVLRDGRGALLAGHIELDLGTMSHARLRAKLAGYLAHAQQARPARPPALLFITVGASRAEAFLRSARRLQAQQAGRGAETLAIAASAHARHPAAVLADRCWRRPGGDEPHTLTECLSASRR